MPLKTTPWWIVATVASASRMFAVAPEPSANPFQQIAVANVFRLKPLVVVSPPPIAKPPLPPMMLTGIVDGYSKLFALLEVSPPNQPKIWLKLAPGQHEGGIEVLSVDIKAGTVELRVSDTVTKLVLNRNATQTAGATKPFTLTGNSASPIAVLSPVQPQLGRDETALIIEAERERLRQAGDPQANLMPVTHLTPAGAPGTEASSSPESQAAGINPRLAPMLRRGQPP